MTLFPLVLGASRAAAFIAGPPAASAGSLFARMADGRAAALRVLMSAQGWLSRPESRRVADAVISVWLALLGSPPQLTVVAGGWL